VRLPEDSISIVYFQSEESFLQNSTGQSRVAALKSKLLSPTSGTNSSANSSPACRFDPMPVLQDGHPLSDHRRVTIAGLPLDD
jgi:hypothetical protein